MGKGEEDWTSFHEKIVDDASLGNPAFVRGAWDAMGQILADNSPTAGGSVERLAAELDRSFQAGHNIFDADNAPGKGE